MFSTQEKTNVWHDIASFDKKYFCICVCVRFESEWDLITFLVIKFFQEIWILVFSFVRPDKVRSILNRLSDIILLHLLSN